MVFFVYLQEEFGTPVRAKIMTGLFGNTRRTLRGSTFFKCDWLGRLIIKCHTWTSHFSKSPTGSTDSRKKYKIILFILKIVLHLYKQNNNTMKKGILINVIEKSITPVLVEEGIQSIYNAIGCSTFEVVEYNNENDIYVDEEGLLSLTPESKFFQIKGYPQPICGNGLILGFDDETGESKDTTLSVMELIDKVLFLDMFEVQMKVRFPHLV